MFAPFQFCTSPTVRVVGRELTEETGSELEVADALADEPSLQFESELSGEVERFDRALLLSSISSPSVEGMKLLTKGACLVVSTGDLMTFARARFTTETCRTMVAGVTVIVDMLESRLSLVNSTFNSDDAGREPSSGSEVVFGVGSRKEEVGDESAPGLGARIMS
jgi:hypothetical protein